jgi:hypothetical protein
MRRLLALFALATLATSCGDSPTAIDNVHVGVYNLISFNGDEPPVVVLEDEEGVLEITGGKVTLNADGTFTDETTLRNTLNGEVTTGTETGSGTYAKNGGIITFTLANNAGIYSMSFTNNNKLTQVVGTATFVYQR